MRTRYLHKVYRDGIFLRCLPQPSSDFSYSQDMGTAGIQIQVDIPATLEDAGVDVSTDVLVTEDGFNIVTENGNNILLRKDYVFGNIPLDLGNQLRTIKFHDGAVNGEVAFDGLITSWGTSYSKNNLTLTAMSWGVKLDNYLIETASNTAVLKYQVANSEITQYTFNYNGTLVNDAFFAQTFQVLSQTTISSVKILMRVDPASGPVTYVCQLNQKAPGASGPFLAYVERAVTNTDQDWVEFTFSTPVTLYAGITYNIQTFINSGGQTLGPVYLATDSAGGYANGTLLVQSPNGSGIYTDRSIDINFQIITSSGGGNIGGNFLSRDPSAIVRELLDSFGRRGGKITYTPDTVPLSNTVTSYNFIFDTILDGIKKCQELAPSNWFWYVHPGTSVLYFKRQGTTANHTFKKGMHVEDLDLEYTLDDVKNTVYFSGGEVSGSNLLTLNTNAISQGKYGVWLDKPSDNRVTLKSTADLLSRSIINQNADPVFRTTVSLPATLYPIETIQIGDMVDFFGWNALIDSLLLQIVGIDKTTDLITLHLNTLPPQTVHRVEDIKRNLDAVVTVNNPSTAA